MKRETIDAWKNRLVVAVALAEYQLYRKHMPKGCDCYETLKKKLEEERKVELEHGSFGVALKTGQYQDVITFFYKKGKVRKSLVVAAVFCPLCGKKYP